MAAFNRYVLIPSGAKTNQTSAAKSVPPDTDSIAFRFVCEAAGTAVSWLVQASLDDIDVPDQSSFFFPLGYILDTAPNTIVYTPRAGPTVAGTAQEMFPAVSPPRKYRKFRCVISGLTGSLAYRIEMFTLDIE